MRVKVKSYYLPINWVILPLFYTIKNSKMIYGSILFGLKLKDYLFIILYIIILHLLYLFAPISLITIYIYPYMYIYNSFSHKINTLKALILNTLIILFKDLRTVIIDIISKRIIKKIK